MRVELVEHMPGAGFSGIGRYTRELYRCLAERVPVRLTTNVDPPFAGRLTFLHHLPVGVREHQPGALVHFQQIMGCAQMLWRPVRPAVATVHGLGPLVWPEEARRATRLDRLLLRLSLLGLKRMDYLIAVSEFTGCALIGRLGVRGGRVRTVHSGVDHALFRPRPRAEALERLHSRYGLPTEDEAKILLYVGSEAPRKNVGTLLRTLALVRRKLPAVSLVKVGPAGGHDFRLRTQQLIAELDLAGAVAFFDRVPDDDLPYFYSAADLYVCCSYVEGFGLPVLEAMACGTPVICSRAGALPEVVGDAGVLLPPDDAEAYATRILQALQDTDRREDMAAGSLRQAAGFRWEKTVAGTLASYREASGAEGR